MIKEKVLKGKCRCCNNKIRIAKSEIDNKVDMRSLTKCPDGYTYCPVCHTPVKVR